MTRLTATTLPLLRWLSLGLACAVAAACSNSSSSPATSVPSASVSTPVTALTGTPINLMVAGTLSGPTNLPELPYGAEAAAARINSLGGIDGRPLKIIVCDDSNPSPDACARKAVADHVAAVVGSQSVGINPVLEANGIAQVGNFPLGPDDYTRPNSFPLCAGSGALGGAAKLLSQLGAKSVVPVGITGGAAVLAAFNQLRATAAHVQGLRVLPEIPLPFPSTELSAQVTEAQNTRADAMVVIGVPAQNVQLLQAVKSLGDAQKVVFFGPTFAQTLITQLKSLANGTYIVSSFRPLTSNNPAVAQFKSDMAKYAHGQELSDVSMNSWAAVQLFEIAAKKVATLDAASILKVMPTLRNINLGVSGTFSFGAKGPLPGLPRLTNTQVFFSHVVNGVAVPLSESPVTSYP